jgi:hypothetical protein
MTTCRDILDEISAQLHGWGSSSDRVTPLTNTLNASDLTFTVDATFGQSVGIAPGVIEIDSEQLYVTKVDATTGSVTLANGFGRGYNGTTPATHAAGSRIISRPRFPRTNLLKQVNQIIGSLYPRLFVPKTWTGTVTYPTDTYTISPVPMTVLDVQWQDPIGNWHKCQGYSLDTYDQTLRLANDAMVGRPLRVTYGVEPTQFASESDDFAVTGLPASCADVLTLGSVAKLVPGLDISRAQLTSVEQSDRSRVVPPSAGVTVARYLMAEYQERLANEAKALRTRYKPTIRRVR